MGSSSTSFTARLVGSTGHEILRDAEVVAWTIDGYWAAVIVALLNGRGAHPGPMKLGDAKELSAATLGTLNETGKPPVPGDPEEIARDAISHLSYNGLALRWEIPGEPSEAVRALVASYLTDGEIGDTMSDLVSRYVMQQLADDHLGLRAIEMPEEGQGPSTGE
jgi:hypothetical protein